MKDKIVRHEVAHRHIRLYRASGEATTFPWPFDLGDDHVDAAHVARYSPERLTKAQAMELASIADAYKTLITHPVRSVAEQIFDLRRAFTAECKAFELAQHPSNCACGGHP